MLANIPPPPGNAVELGPLTIHYYGIAIAIGVLVAISLARRRYANAGGDPDLADRVAIVAVVAGLAGARVGFVTTNHDRFFWDNLLGVFAVWQGGLTFYTGLLFGALGAIWFLRRGRGSLPAFADAAAPAIPIAQAFGRWGNYFNQELYGSPTTLPWALELERDGVVVDTVHPTFLYEMLGNLLLAGLLLWVGGKHKLRQGSLLFGYLAGYGSLRFGMELLRVDTDPVLFGLTRNGMGSIAVFLVGVGGLWLHQRRPLLPDWSSALTDAPASREAIDAGEPRATGEPTAGDESFASEDADVGTPKAAEPDPEPGEG